MRKVRSVAVFAMIVLIVSSLTGCSVKNQKVTQVSEQQIGEDKVTIKDRVFTLENMNRAITFIKGLQTSITIVGPLACTGVSLFQPAALPACSAAMAGHQAIVAVTNQVIAIYEKNPTPENAQAVLDSIGTLKQAWADMDAQYKSKKVVKP